MSEKAAARTREKWVDDVKVIACIVSISVALWTMWQAATVTWAT